MCLRFLMNQEFVSFFFVCFFCEPPPAPTLVKNLVVIQLADKMESVDGTLWVNPVLVFNGTTRAHASAPLVLFKRFTRSTGFHDVLSLYIRIIYVILASIFLKLISQFFNSFLIRNKIIKNGITPCRMYVFVNINYLWRFYSSNTFLCD